MNKTGLMGPEKSTPGPWVVEEVKMSCLPSWNFSEGSGLYVVLAYEYYSEVFTVWYCETIDDSD
jgi:hypothetical protein